VLFRILKSIVHHATATIYYKQGNEEATQAAFYVGLAQHYIAMVDFGSFGRSVRSVHTVASKFGTNVCNTGRWKYCNNVSS
jgi:hypothetical protein